jgi:tripartite ATP-independent transporter DctP family solute receptor
MQVIKRVVALTAALLVIGSVQAQQVKERVIRVGIGLNDEHPQAAAVRKFGELLNKQSGGKITVRLYPSGQLGNDVSMTSALQGGTLDMTVPDTSTLVSHVKDFGVINLPFVIGNEKEADALLDGPFGQKILAKLPERGLIGLGFWENGFRHVTNSRRPIQKVDDFSGLKLRVIPNPLFVETFKALGVNAIPMPFPEVFSAMETRTVDGQENPVATILASKFYEVQPHLVLSNHIYSAWVLLMSKKTWDSLSADEQKMVAAAANEAKLFERKTIRDFSANAVAELKKNGMKVTELPPAEVNALRNKVQPVVARFSTEFGAAAAEEMNAELAKIRGNKK